VNALKSSYPYIKIIGFPKGFQDLESYCKTGIDGLSVDHHQTLDLKMDILLQGNLSPEILLEGGERLLIETRRILDIMKGRKFIFNLGHGILPQTPIKHVEQLVKIVRG
jgi:uroporphyrinogen decarboxylase